MLLLTKYILSFKTIKEFTFLKLELEKKVKNLLIHIVFLCDKINFARVIISCFLKGII